MNFVHISVWTEKTRVYQKRRPTNGELPGNYRGRPQTTVELPWNYRGTTVELPWKAPKTIFATKNIKFTIKYKSCLNCSQMVQKRINPYRHKTKQKKLNKTYANNIKH